MVAVTPPLERITEERVVWEHDRPLTFERYLDLFMGASGHVELIDGVAVERMAASYEHESLYAWLFTLLNLYVIRHKLGEVLGSRSAVKIDEYGGRLPDILFIKRERHDTIQPNAIYGPPDLVIELVSPNDRPSDLNSLEKDYRSIHVPEIWFIDPRKRQVRALTLGESGYKERLVKQDRLHSASVEGFSLELDWLFTEPSPDPLDALRVTHA